MTTYLFSRPKEIVEFLINLGAYSYPDTIALPPDYTPPSMAIKPTYWKVILLNVKSIFTFATFSFIFIATQKGKKFVHFFCGIALKISLQTLLISFSSFLPSAIAIDDGL